MNSQNTYCGYVAIVGRPNVGKSTLLNHLLGTKVSITARKPQTTRHRILGILTENETQIVFVDTPGIHSKAKQALNRYMNAAADYAIHDVDLILFVIDVHQFNQDDILALEKIKSANIPTICIINKVDRVKNKQDLLPLIEDLKAKMNFEALIPVSAKTGENTNKLIPTIQTYLPQGPHFFPEDQITDRPIRFMISEIIREKLFRETGQELPYGLTIEIEKMKREKKVMHIAALILVEKKSHKQIVIGNKGERLKSVGSKARKDIEKLIDEKVFLQLWVKVRSGWADDERALKSLGYE